MKRILALALLSAIAAAPCAAQTIHLEKGNYHIIKLESNRTTGYKWELTSLGKENKVQVEELPFKLATEPLKAVGQGGIQSWKITGIGKGHTRAIFDYKPSWEPTSIKTEIFDFIVE